MLFVVICVLLYGVCFVCDALCDCALCCNTCAVVISCVVVWIVCLCVCFCSPSVCVVFKCVRVLFVV